MPPTHILLLNAFKIMLISLHEAISVEELLLKPYCFYANMLLPLI
jgi:hypothetical protein